jgi:uroporphyrinogen decarboxylase
VQVDELTSAERMRHLRKKEPIDRVPVNLSAQLYAAQLTGTSFKDFWNDPETGFRAQMLTQQLHNADEAPSYAYGWSDWIINELGGAIQYSNNPYDLPTVIKRPIDKLEDIETLTFPDPRSGPVTKEKWNCARLNVQRGGKAGVQCGLTRTVGAIAGNERLMRWYYTEPGAVHALYRKVTDYMLNTLDLYIKEFGAEKCNIHIAAPMDSQCVISPRTFEKFGYVYYKEVIKKAAAAGVALSEIHLCGNHVQTIQLWKEMPIPPRTSISIGAEMDIKKTAEFFGPDYIIAGNVPTQLLHLGTPEEILTKCQEILDAVKYNPGGFILRSACGMPANAPPINVHAMMIAARTYGKY